MWVGWVDDGWKKRTAAAVGTKGSSILCESKKGTNILISFVLIEWMVTILL